MILRAGDVVDLQLFLMEVAKRYAVAGGERSRLADDLLANAAALDYVLLLCSERGHEPLDPEDPICESLRETVTKAAGSALDLAASMTSAPRETFEDFSERYLRPIGSIFDTIRSLRENGMILSPDLTFRALTIASDLIERRQRKRR